MHLIEVNGLPANKHLHFRETKGDNEKIVPIEKTSTDRRAISKRQLESMKLPTWVDDDYVKEMIKSRKKKYQELIKRCQRAESLRKLEEAYTLKTVRFDHF